MNITETILTILSARYGVEITGGKDGKQQSG